MAVTIFCINGVDDFKSVYVSSPALVSKSTRQRATFPEISAKLAHAAAAISAPSSRLSGSSVGRPVSVCKMREEF